MVEWGTPPAEAPVANTSRAADKANHVATYKGSARTQ